MNIGLLMVAEENDILERVLATHETIADVLYILDGTTPNRKSKSILTNSPMLGGYWTDADLPRPPYPEGTTCGYRGFIYDQAVEEHGYDHWFLELHGDEVWTFHPAEVIDEYAHADGFIFRLPFYFPREKWKPNVHPLDQLHWHYRPGWPEFRMFKGGPDVRFDPNQHFNTQPSGLNNIVWDHTHRINHYPYRSPKQQKLRADHHAIHGLDPANYAHAAAGDFYWTDEMVEQARCPNHHELVA